MVGLGNPGDRYTGTRHNVGFDAVQAFAEKAAGGPPRLDRLDCRALTGRVRVGDRPVLVARPQTYMNASGESVKGLVARYGVPLERLVVVLDEVALPVGSVRFRRSGSSGGQKGLQSVIDCLGTSEFPRLRLGVRGEHFEPGEPKDDYILSRFSKKERPSIDEAIATACDALEAFVTDGIDAAMNRYNRSPEESSPAT
ncbi:MAG TPA: aminoacyl-tRNA hydrolase [Thermoanaerobaculia bacterium]|nr:aminoacyl-tRNA hydrolase [Thermoanaerobaculia bacterium]